MAILEMILGLVLLGTAIAVVRAALMQRAVDRAGEGKEVGSLDDLFTREYKGEPKTAGWLDPPPNRWPIRLFSAVVFGMVGIALVIRGFAGAV